MNCYAFSFFLILWSHHGLSSGLCVVGITDRLSRVLVTFIDVSVLGGRQSFPGGCLALLLNQPSFTCTFRSLMPLPALAFLAASVPGSTLQQVCLKRGLGSSSRCYLQWMPYFCTNLILLLDCHILFLVSSSQYLYLNNFISNVK